MKRAWRLADSNNHYYHQVDDGLVVGHVFNYAHTIVWGAKVPSPLDRNDDIILGRYVEMEFAKRAVEGYWDKSDKTINLTLSPDVNQKLNTLLVKD
jgi:hypothetical protein